jgi:hypothetical protein
VRGSFILIDSILHKADKDCREEEDNSFAKGLQKRAPSYS